MLQYDPKTAVTYLRDRDPKLAKIITRVGQLELTTDQFDTPFHSLTHAILNQQLSRHSANSIYKRLRALLGGRITVPRMIRADPNQLREVGLSQSKILAVKDLASHYQRGEIPNVRALKTLEDEEIVQRLIQVKGIGRWTVEMLLIFHLGRADILPISDLGIRKGFKVAYACSKIPSEKQLQKHGQRWQPYRSAASWYLWRANDL